MVEVPLVARLEALPLLVPSLALLSGFLFPAFPLTPYALLVALGDEGVQLTLHGLAPADIAPHGPPRSRYVH